MKNLSRTKVLYYWLKLKMDTKVGIESSYMCAKGIFKDQVKIGCLVRINVDVFQKELIFTI